MGTTEKLARFIAETPPAAIPHAAFEQAKLRFLDTLGVALGGARHASTAIALETTRALGGNAHIGIIGHAERASVELGGFVNGVAAHALEYDDLTRGVTHLSASVVPGAFAMGEYSGATGRKMLESFIVGFQAATQIAKGLGATLFDRGWHSPSPLGAFGVAAAACRSRGFDTQRTRMALGVTASEAAGIRKNVGSMGKAFHVGNAVRCGIFAALLAERGFTVDPDAIEGVNDGSNGHGRFGLAETFNGAGNYDLALMERGLGTEWELTRKTTVVRLHPGVTALSSAIDGMIDLANEHDLRAEDVSRIDLQCTAQVAKLGSYREATNGHTARFCIPYTMAVSLIDRKAGLAQYTDERVRKADVQTLMKRVQVRVPDDLRAHEGAWTGSVNWGLMRLHVELENGRTVSVARESARGWPEQPATWNDLAEKFRDCADGVLSRTHIERSIGLIESLDELRDLSPLVAALQGRG